MALQRSNSRPARNVYHKWAILWVQNNRLDGKRAFFVGEPKRGMTMLFRTRAEARKYRDARYGYIRDREDLKHEPHGWKLPQVVKVCVDIKEL